MPYVVLFVAFVLCLVGMWTFQPPPPPPPREVRVEVVKPVVVPHRQLVGERR